MSINIERYYRAYQKQPRGRGNWAFSDRAEQRIQFFFGTYTEARKQAIQWAKQNGIDMLYLLS